MSRTSIYLAAVAVFSAISLTQGALAAPVGENDFASAIIEMDRGKPEGGQRVQSLLMCLKNWNASGNAQDNKVTIERNGSVGFTVKATLRGPTLFHFDVRQEQGDTIALLKEIEYQRPGEMFDSIRDADSKRAVLRSVCSTP
jgi:hypothetical protein